MHRHINMIIVGFIVFAAISLASCNPDIVYKITDAYKVIWTDKGSGGTHDGSVWTVLNYQNEFCSLGDAVSSNHGRPATKAVLVSAKKNGALIQPTSFTKVWDDKESGADKDVAVYRMNAPAGYTCLGSVAMPSFTTLPDATKYCCVKNEYVVRADTVFAYNDVNTGADKDVSLWTVIRTGGEVNGVSGGNFIVVNGYSKPSIAFLLKANEKVRDLWSLPVYTNKPLNLYENGQLKQIWTDRGSGASADVAFWRSQSSGKIYSVGDIAVATYTKPKIGFLLKATDPHGDAFRAPVSYSQIWSDRGSGADHDVKLWRVNCPPRFVALGHISTPGNYPNFGDVYCVNSKYTIYGSTNNWAYVWNDRKSGADKDVGIYEAKSTSSNQQSVKAFGAIQSWYTRPNPPYLLNTKFVTYWAEKPIEKIIMTNVKYDLNSEMQQKSPIKMHPTTILNNSGEEQSVTRVIEYSKSESKAFTFSQAIELGISVEITAGTPLIGAEQKTTISIVSTSTFTTGSTTTTTHTDKIFAKIKLPGNSKIVATITATEYKADIPYTATIKKIYYDGTHTFADISGVYKGVDIAHVEIAYGKIEKLS